MQLTNPYRKAPISNGNPDEQALIRKWWQEKCDGKGVLVWEYYVDPYYIDALWFKDNPNHGREYPGRNGRIQFPVSGEHVVLCEAKLSFNPELIGQALTYSFLLMRAGAKVERTVIFTEQSNSILEDVAQKYGLEVE